MPSLFSTARTGIKTCIHPLRIPKHVRSTKRDNSSLPIRTFDHISRGQYSDHSSLQFDISHHRNDGHLTQHSSIAECTNKTHSVTNCIKTLMILRVYPSDPKHIEAAVLGKLNTKDSSGNEKIRFRFRFHHLDKIPIPNSNTVLARNHDQRQATQKQTI